jgi:hypothetical protein
MGKQTFCIRELSVLIAIALVLSNAQMVDPHDVTLGRGCAGLESTRLPVQNPSPFEFRPCGADCRVLKSMLIYARPLSRSVWRTSLIDAALCSARS